MRNMSWSGALTGAHASAGSGAAKTRLADVLCVLAWYRGAARLERERCATLTAALRAMRPGLWISDRDEAGRERIIGYCPDHPQPMTALVKVTR
jgi:hypothetical protein